MIPDTIKHPENFMRSQWSVCCPHCHRTIGFDGIFDWGWVIEALKKISPKTKIMPMDFDGVIERKCHYLLFETKDEGKNIIEAQRWTLERIIRASSVTIMYVWGKESPISFEAQTILRNGKRFRVVKGMGRLESEEYVSRWFRWAENDGAP
jgi:hypothetical protein